MPVLVDLYVHAHENVQCCFDQHVVTLLLMKATCRHYVLISHIHCGEQAAFNVEATENKRRVFPINQLHWYSRSIKTQFCAVLIRNTNGRLAVAFSTITDVITHWKLWKSYKSQLTILRRWHRTTKHDFETPTRTWPLF